jgi:hypothetical protein
MTTQQAIALGFPVVTAAAVAATALITSLYWSRKPAIEGEHSAIVELTTTGAVSADAEVIRAQASDVAGWSKDLDARVKAEPKAAIAAIRRIFDALDRVEAKEKKSRTRDPARG